MKREREKLTVTVDGARIFKSVWLRPATHAEAKAVAKEHEMPLGMLVSLMVEDGLARYRKEGRLPRPPWSK